VGQEEREEERRGQGSMPVPSLCIQCPGNELDRPRRDTGTEGSLLHSSSGTLEGDLSAGQPQAVHEEGLGTSVTYIASLNT
jgi:hypothetical protein